MTLYSTHTWDLVQALESASPASCKIDEEKIEIQVLLDTTMITKELINSEKVLIPILKAYIIFY